MTRYMVGTGHTLTHFPEHIGRRVGLDIETTYDPDVKGSADPHIERIHSISIANETDSWICDDAAAFPSILPILQNPDAMKLMHGGSFDLKFLIHKLGAVVPKDSVYDTLLVERILHAGYPVYMKHRLNDVLARRLGVLLNKETRDTFAHHVGAFSAEQLDYAEQDVIHLTKLHDLQLADISKTRTGRVVRLENRLVPLIARMELRGVNFDPELWQVYRHQIWAKMQEIKQRFVKLLNIPVQLNLFEEGVELPEFTETIDIQFNLNSTKQVANLYKELGIKVPGTGDDVMEAWLVKNPKHKGVEVVRLIQEWRKWSKAFSWGTADTVSPITHRVHCNWNQIQADTGRFSSSNPNMQNVERPTEGRPNFRHLFPAPDGYLYVIFDFSQQEPRILAQISEDPDLRRVCQSGDVYSAMIKEVYKKDVDKKDPLRQIFKTCVLAMFYGASPETVAADQHQPIEMMQHLQLAVFKAFPKARGYSDRVKVLVKNNGVTRTALGRPRFYPETQGVMKKDISFKQWARIYNQAINAPIQGTGADMIKMSMDILDDKLSKHGYDALPIMPVHDELVVESKEGQAEEVFVLTKESFEEAGRELCPDVAMLAEGIIDKRWQKT